MKHANIITNVNVKRLANIKRTIIKISNKGKTERQLMSDIIDEIQNQLNEAISKINNDIITQRAKSLSKNKRFDKNSFWRLKRNLFSKQRENKVSAINTQGTELFDPIKEYQNKFIKHLSLRQMDQDYKGIEEISSGLFNIPLGISRGMILSGVSNPRPRPYDPHDADPATLYPRPYDPAHDPTTLSTTLRPGLRQRKRYFSPSTKLFNELHFPIRLFSRAIHFARPFARASAFKLGKLNTLKTDSTPTTLRYDIHSKIKSKTTLINQIIS